MADNTTQGGSDTLATDDLTTINGSASSGVKVERVKIGYGSDGSFRDVDSTYPLPVDSELTTANLDTGGGTDTRAVVGLASAESGGGVLVGSSNPLPVGDGGGSITVDGSVTVGTALPAGDNNIGNVDIATMPAADRTTDSIAAAPEFGKVVIDGTVYTVTTVIVDASTSGNNTIVSAVASKTIRVLAFDLVANAAVTAYWRDGTAGSKRSGSYYFGGTGHGIAKSSAHIPVLATGSVNTALVLNLSGAVAVGGTVSYITV